MIHWLVAILLVSLVAASAASLLAVVRRRLRSSNSSRMMLRVAFAALTALIVVLALRESVAPLPENRADSYLWLSWGVLLLSMLLGRRVDYPIFEAFVAPLALICAVSSSILAHRGGEVQTGLPLSMKLLHLMPAILSEASLLFAGIVSIILLIQERRLKSKRDTLLLVNGPNLMNLSTVARMLVLVGFVAMSFSVISGSLWAIAHGVELVSTDLLQWTGFAVWAMLGIILIRDRAARCAPVVIARMTVSATSLLAVFMIVYFVWGGSLRHGS